MTEDLLPLRVLGEPAPCVKIRINEEMSFQVWRLQNGAIDYCPIFRSDQIAHHLTYLHKLPKRRGLLPTVMD